MLLHSRGRCLTLQIVHCHHAIPSSHSFHQTFRNLALVERGSTLFCNLSKSLCILGPFPSTPDRDGLTIFCD